MSVIKQKAKMKCECGRTVSKGSVFCPHCRAEINRKNVRTMKRGEYNFHKRMRSQGRGRKK